MRSNIRRRCRMAQTPAPRSWGRTPPRSVGTWAAAWCRRGAPHLAAARRSRLTPVMLVLVQGFLAGASNQDQHSWLSRHHLRHNHLHWDPWLPYPPTPVGHPAGGGPATELITAHGAIGDNATMNTRPINDAVAACVAGGGGFVVVPAGVFLTGTVVHGGPREQLLPRVAARGGVAGHREHVTVQRRS